MSIANAVLSALVQTVLFAGLPFLAYAAWHRWRCKRSFADTCRRAGLQLGNPRYLLYSLAMAAVVVAALVIHPPPLEPMLREGSAQSGFAGLGLTIQAIVLALLYGMVKTGFSEELLFRGLVAGSLSRRLPLRWANLVQALIFLLPHLLILMIAPALWTLLPVVFVLALVLGWLRIKSGSILGPWLVHGSTNVAMALIVAVKTVA